MAKPSGAAVAQFPDEAEAMIIYMTPLLTENCLDRTSWGRISHKSTNLRRDPPSRLATIPNGRSKVDDCLP
jgi:hypothetical protein